MLFRSIPLQLSVLVLGTLISGFSMAQSSSSSSSNSSCSSSSTPYNPSPALLCTVNSDQPWGEAYQAMVDVTNNTDYPMSEWQVYLDLADGHTVNHYWDAVVETSAGATVARNASWNGSLQPGQMVRFGIMGNHPGAFVEPTCAATPKPNADFAVEVHGPTVYVHATAPNPVGNWQYRIDFGDGHPVPTPHSQAWRTYASPGEYTITMTVTDGNQTATQTRTVVATEHTGGNHAPVARTFVDQPYGGSPTHSGGLSYDVDGQPVSQQWTAVNVGGVSYRVLTVSDGELGDTTFARTYPVSCGGSYHSYPSASFTYSVEGRTLRVDARNSYGAYLQWNFGDGNTSSTVITSHTYAEPGEYELLLEVFGGPHRRIEMATIVVE